MGRGKFTGEVTLPELLLWFSFRLCTVFFFGAVQNLSIFLSAEYGTESRKCRADRLYERSASRRNRFNRRPMIAIDKLWPVEV